MALNLVYLQGVVTRKDPVITTGSGLAISKFCVGISSGKDKDGKYKPSTYLDCICFGSVSNYFENAANVKDGVFIEGKIDISDYITKDGVKHKKTNIIANKIVLTKNTYGLPASPKDLVDDTPVIEDSTVIEKEIDDMPF